jgi:hypothetical protein
MNLLCMHNKYLSKLWQILCKILKNLVKMRLSLLQRDNFLHEVLIAKYVNR